MALSNRDRVGRGLEVLRAGLEPFVERELRARLGGRWQDAVERGSRHELRKRNGSIEWDTPALLSAMLGQWDEVFRYTLGPPQRSLVHEIRGVRNDWAHERAFSTDQTYRALDSMKLLLQAVSAGEQARELERQAVDVLRIKFTEQARTEGRRVEAVSGQPLAGLPPWREVITPHEDVYSGRYEQAEFAADLAQVYRGEGESEYRDPREFFRRTFLTEGLRRLLGNALRRLSGAGGDPVVELQTNFGGGKTHSMLALYHLFSGTLASDLAGVEPLLRGAGVSFAVKANRAVLVGTALSPGQTDTKPDGTVVRTLWGEMAWQLGGADGYAMVEEADRTGTSPGSNVLSQLFEMLSPCLILVDEWVAYLRNLYGVPGLPAGSFDANLTFAQALTEAAKAAPDTLVVASLPASQIEIGGEGGEEALTRLKQTFSRVESTWRPASADESFEIVRRRLFREDSENHPARDLVVRRFSEMYRAQSGTFPSGCGETDYRRRLEAAYPIHPELFDRLYSDWSSLERFQRTRGVLRLLATVIHALWEGEDKNLLIMPSTVPMENGIVQDELTRYMQDHWSSVIGKDVDGPNSLPLRLDRENPNLGRYSACRRVARTIYMGSAPTAGAANPGIEEKNVLLGCLQPGETPATFGDALRRLTDGATFLYVDAKRYWYSTQASVTRLAQDRAEGYDTDDVNAEIVRRLRAEKSRGEFASVHVAPDGSSEVPDEREARLVIIGPENAHTGRDRRSPALHTAQQTLESRGSSPRIYRNTLVFLAADSRRLKDLEGRVRQLLAWASIEGDADALNLTRLASRQAATKKAEAESAVAAQMGEAWSWCLVPEQPDPLGEVEWAEIRAGGSVGDPLAVRASKKLVSEELLLPSLGAARLKMELDRALWRDADHIGVRQLWEYLCSYLYLPRLRDGDVLLRAIQDGISTVAASDLFAYAGGYDEESGMYVGLRTGGGGSVTLDSSSLLVKPEAARAQEELEEEEASRRERERIGRDDGGGQTGLTYAPGDGGHGRVAESPPDTEVRPSPPRRFYASVTLNPDRVGRDAGKIADEVLSHLSTLPGARLNVSIEIEAEMPQGAPEDVQRTVSENARVLRFDSHGFEQD
jgi:predicted AAA+ superfamily ATPase